MSFLMQTTFDHDDKEDWLSIREVFDKDNELIKKTTIYDDGLKETVTWKEHLGDKRGLVKTVTEDVKDDHDWQTRTQQEYAGSDGAQHKDVKTIFDDGRDQIIYHKDGWQTGSFEIDRNDAYDWDMKGSAITTQDGKYMRSDSTRYDDGRVNIEKYENFAFVSSEEVDHQDEYSWRQINIYTSSETGETTRIVFYDDGNMTFESVDGSRYNLPELTEETDVGPGGLEIGWGNDIMG